MDRLFRAEAEEFERERAQESAVEVGAYLAPAPEPVLEEPAASEVPGPRARKPLLLALAAVVVVAVIVGVALKFGVGSSSPPPTPTPSAEEIAAQRQAQEQKMRELAAGLVREMMAEKEEEIRQELLERQSKIEELQKRLQDSERRARSGQLSNAEQQKQAELARQIAAEEEAQRKREAELEAERQRAEEEARQQAAAQQEATATAVAEEQARVVAAATAPTPSPVFDLSPTPPQQVAPSPTSVVIEENSFFEPSEVDTLPVVLKTAPVAWSRSALYSRRKGVVIVQATVDAYGGVEDVKVLRADNEGFGIPQSVVDAVRKYRFKPGTKHGVNIKTYATVTQPYHFVVR
jgi:TonB family protein